MSSCNMALRYRPLRLIVGLLLICQPAVAQVRTSVTASAYCVSTPGVDQQLLSACERLLPSLSSQLSTTDQLTGNVGTHITLTGSGSSSISTSSTSPSTTTSSVASSSGAAAAGASRTSGTFGSSPSYASSASRTAGGVGLDSSSQNNVGTSTSQSSSTAVPTGADTKAGAEGNQATSNSHSHYINHVLIPAVVVGVVGGLIVLGLLLWLCLALRRRSRRRRNEHDTVHETPQMSQAPISYSEKHHGGEALAGAGAGAIAAGAVAAKPHHESDSSGAPMIGAGAYNSSTRSSPSSDPLAAQQPHELEPNPARLDHQYAQYGALPPATVAAPVSKTLAPPAAAIGTAYTSLDGHNRSSYTESEYDNDQPHAAQQTTNQRGIGASGPQTVTSGPTMASGTWLAGFDAHEAEEERQADARAAGVASSTSQDPRAPSSHGRTNSESSFDPFVTPSTGSRSSALNREELLRGGPWDNPNYDPHSTEYEDRATTPTQPTATSSFYQQSTPPRRTSRRIPSQHGEGEIYPSTEEAGGFSFGFDNASTTEASSTSNRMSTRTVRASDQGNYRTSASSAGGAAAGILGNRESVGAVPGQRTSSHSIPRRPVASSSSAAETNAEGAAAALEGQRTRTDTAVRTGNEGHTEQGLAWSPPGQPWRG